jgi:hypothetical protein
MTLLCGNWRLIERGPIGGPPDHLNPVGVSTELAKTKAPVEVAGRIAMHNVKDHWLFVGKGTRQQVLYEAGSNSPVPVSWDQLKLAQMKPAYVLGHLGAIRSGTGPVITLSAICHPREARFNEARGQCPLIVGPNPGHTLLSHKIAMTLRRPVTHSHDPLA